MAYQPSAHVPRSWKSSKDWLHTGRTLMVGRRRFLLSFLKCMCFILSAITAVGRPGANVGPWGTNNTLSSAPSAERGNKRHILDCLRGGPTVVSLKPLLFRPGWSGGLLRRRFQGELGPGSLVLWEGVALCRAGTASILPILRRSGLRSGWCWLSCLLSRRRLGWMEAAEELVHFGRKCRIVWEILSLCEAFCKALHSWSKQAAWRDRSAEGLPSIRLPWAGRGRRVTSVGGGLAFVMMWMSSSSVLSLALREVDSGKREGSVTEPDNSSTSKATRERLSSISLSLSQNEIMSLAATEGRWSCWVKRTDECSLCSEGETCGHWADVSSLVTGCSNPLPCCFLPSHRRKLFVF